MRKVRIENNDGVWLRETSPGRHLEAGVRVRVHSKLFAEGAEGKCLGNGSVHAPPRTKDIQRVREAVLFEDEECIVINKPSGIAVQGGSKIAAGRHLDAWMQHVVGGKEKPRLVHRLDRETSGCLVMAKTRVAASALASAFKEGRVEKMYVALVAGCIPCNSGARQLLYFC
jgi:23S rRNA-/tRNA-specific pseudouridylate synthase